MAPDTIFIFMCLAGAGVVANWTTTVYKHPEQFGAMQVQTCKSNPKAPVRRRARRSIGNLPTFFDARQKWPHCQSLFDIRHQSCCGSCYAVSTASMMSDRWCIHSGGRFQVYLGVADYLACCKDCNKCIGGCPLKALQFMRDFGFTSGGPFQSSQGCHSYPFNPDGECNMLPECRRECQPSYGRSFIPDLKYSRDPFRLEMNESQIMYEVLNYGPVVVGFDLFEDLKSYRGGIYVHQFQKGEEKEISHAVRLLGWGVENGIKYWLLANSWGKDWGENGFFRFLRGENHINVEEWVFAAMPNYEKKGSAPQDSIQVPK